VTGCLLSQTSGADLIKAVRATTTGNACFSPAIPNRLARQYHPAFLSARPVRRLMSMLTTRELEVWQLIAEGQASKQIAFDLFISVKTVEKHRQNLMNKLNIHHVAGLTRYAIAEGIIKAVPEERNSLVPWPASAIAR
jgi:DNA-binding NarL/FixJ family response regulator